MNNSSNSSIILRLYVAGSTEAERRAFTVLALKRIHLASQRGVARLIRAHEPIPDGPCILPPRGLIQLGVLPRGPLVQAPLMKQSEGQIPEWRNEVQRALMALSTYKTFHDSCCSYPGPG